uniref:sensor histidine kinase n=1 Tax=Saccharopolyspora galaxeae TaxID=2781241 RepID=UPI0040407A03
MTRPLRILRVCLHLLMAALLVLAALRGALGGAPYATAISLAAVAMGAVYAAGPALPRIRRSPRAAAGWLGVLVIAWLVLLALTPDGVWLAFPLFFLQLHLLPLRAGVSAVAASTLLAIGGFAWHAGRFSPAAAIGPIIGAAVAVATVLAYQALYRESEHRRRLLDELETARNDLAEAERTAGVLEERGRLAREIHDTLAQGLSSIQLLLRAAERSLPEGAAAEHVTRARRTAQDNLAEARRFVHDLTPPALDDEPLPAALRRLCANTTERAGLPVEFHLSGTPITVATPIEAALLRIAQSAVANTVAHARATHVAVTLTYMDDSITLDVLDDGTGFDPAAAADESASAESGFGLAGMRARTADLGGTLAVESEPGRGTALAAAFPLQGRKEVPR